MRISDYKEPEMKFHSFLQNPIILNLKSQKFSRKARIYARKRVKGFIPTKDGGTYNFSKKLNWHTTNPEFLIAEGRKLLLKNGLKALNGITMSLSNAFMLLEVQSREELLVADQEVKLREALLLELILFLEELYKKKTRTINEITICERTVRTIEINLDRLHELTYICAEN